MSICELSTREAVYIGSANEITLIPLTNRLTQAQMDLTGATEVRICVDGIEGSSDDATPPVSWEEQTIDGEDTWVIIVQAGLLPGLTPGDYNMRVTVFDAEYTEGLVITNDLPITAYAAC